MSKSSSVASEKSFRSSLIDEIWKKEIYSEQKYLRNRWYLRDAREMDTQRAYGGPALWLIVVKGKEHCHEGVVIDMAEAEITDAKSKEIKKLPMFQVIALDKTFSGLFLTMTRWIEAR